MGREQRRAAQHERRLDCAVRREAGAKSIYFVKDETLYSSTSTRKQKEKSQTLSGQSKVVTCRRRADSDQETGN